MENKKKTGLKGIAIRCGTIFLIVVLVLTFFSGSIENAMLPEITVVESKVSAMTTTLSSVTTPSYQKVTTIYAPVSVPVVKSYLEYGVGVKQGEVIAQLDTDKLQEVRNQYQNQLLQMDVQIEQAKGSIKQVEKTNQYLDAQIKQMKDQDPKADTKALEYQKQDTSALQKQLSFLQKQYQDIQDQYGKAFENITENGEFLCPIGGIVAGDSFSASGCLVQGQPMFDCAELGSSMKVEWRVDKTAGTRYNTYSPVLVSCTVEGRYRTFDLKVEDKKLDQEKNQYVFTALLPEGELFRLNTQMTAVLKTPEVTRGVTIPKAALQDDGSVFVLRRDEEFGKYYVERVAVEVGEKSDFDAAIYKGLNNGDKVVLSSTRTLDHKMQVKLK